MTLLKWIWADKVSLILWILTFEMVLGYFLTGANYTPFLAIFLLYIVYQIRERGIFVTKVNVYTTNPFDRMKIGLSPVGKKKREPTLFGTIVNVLLLLGSVAILVIVGLRLCGVIGVE